MGKATGFLEYERKNAAVEEPLKCMEKKAILNRLIQVF